MSDDLDFDFGFTAVTEDELDVVKDVTKKAESLGANASNTQDRLDKLYNAITMDEKLFRVLIDTSETEIGSG